MQCDTIRYSYEALIMANYVHHNGYKYSRNPNAENRSDAVYFKRISRGRSVYLHRVIWEEVNGKIPKGFHIHHIDGNPLNNDISNLECLSAQDHINKHPYDDERLERQKTHLDNIRPLTKVWHSSAEGRKWHSDHAKRVFVFESKTQSCLECGCEFQTKASHNKSEFCSNAHKSAYRRKMGYDNIDKACAFCNKIFPTNKYAKIKTCSRSCANRLRHARKLESMNDKT